MFRSWQNNLQNLNGINEVVTFFNGLGQQTLQFKNKINNRVDYFYNLNDLYRKDEETYAKALKKSETPRSDNLKEIYNSNRLREELFKKYRHIFYYVKRILKNLQQQRIQQGYRSIKFKMFTLFMADESDVGDQCSICMEDYEIGRNIMRLNCDGKHAFCQVCIEGWFADHNTCPLCRHIFWNNNSENSKYLLLVLDRNTLY